MLGDWWTEQLILGALKDVLAAGEVGCVNEWLNGWMSLMMAVCHISRPCFDNKSLTMASLLSWLCLFCHVLVWGWGLGRFNCSRVQSHTYVCSCTYVHVQEMMHKFREVGQRSLGQCVNVLSSLVPLDCTAILWAFDELWSEWGRTLVVRWNFSASAAQTLGSRQSSGAPGWNGSSKQQWTRSCWFFQFRV